MAPEPTSTARLSLSSEITQNFAQAHSREWLITNGLGSYAMGTISGAPSRAYHGYLIAATTPPVGRTMLCQHLNETVFSSGQRYDLGCLAWHDGTVAPRGYRQIERFWLDGTLPVWQYRIGSSLIEKRIWMTHGANTTTVRYHLLSGDRATLQIEIAVAERDHHAPQAPQPDVWQATAIEQGWQIQRGSAGLPWTLHLSHGSFAPGTYWVSGIQLATEAERGHLASDNHLRLGMITAEITSEQPLYLSFTTEPIAQLERDGAASLAAAQARERALIDQAGMGVAPLALRQLVLAADQFIVARPVADDPQAKTVIAGYPWFADWGRDTMIALPGLCLATRRYADARAILRTFARFVSEGMLPNRFPDIGEHPEYNTVDATLWYFHAIQTYLSQTGDASLLAELYPVLGGIIAWHERGTRYGIGVDPADGLLRAGQPGAQLTWMDVRIDDWVVTPRHGKAVEINALWYNALRLMHNWAQRHDPASAASYATAAERVQASFGRFWYAAGGYFYDVIDTPNGDDATLRPNQIFALSVAPDLMLTEQRQQAIAAVTDWLLTPQGLRTLDPRHAAYKPRFTGDRWSRDSAYHQGTVWPWLIGHYLDARTALDRSFDRRAALQPLLDHLWDAGLGSISEVFDADPPRHGAACLAQAWSVAEVLRAWVAE